MKPKTILWTLLSAAVIIGACVIVNHADPYRKLYRNARFKMEHIDRPRIPSRKVALTRFGGVGDGISLNTDAFAAAIEHLSQKGGGQLTVPQGVWLTGPIELKSNIELHLDRNAIILFSSDKSLYPIEKTIFEGLDTYRCQSPIKAVDAHDVAITGEGIIDGSGDAWRHVKRDKIAPSDWKIIVRNNKGIFSDDGKTWYPSQSYRLGLDGADFNIAPWAKTEADFEMIHDFLRPVMVSLRNCSQVLLQGVTFQNSPCWNIHPLMCNNMIVDGITVRCPSYAQNGDGIDIESCNNVIVTNSTFDAGDDAICIKSGKDEAGRRRGIACQNVIVDNCTVFHGHGGFVVGSEMSGGVKNIAVTNCKFSGTDVGLRFKSTRGRGGVVENIQIENIAMNDIVTEAVLFDLFYGGKSQVEAQADSTARESTDMTARAVDQTTPQFRDIYINNVSCHGANRAMFFNGLPEMNVENITIENSSFYANTGASINESTSVSLRNVHIVPLNGPALRLNNVHDLKADKFVCPEGMTTAVEVTGSRNDNIRINSDNVDSNNVSLSANSTGKVKIR